MTSIIDNPKEKQIKQHLLASYNESLFSKFWEKRILNFFNTIVPQSKENNKIIIKRNSINDFVSYVENKQIGDLKNIEYLIILEPFSDIFDLIDFLHFIKKKFPDNCKILFYNFNYLWTPIFKLTNFLKFIKIKRRTKYFSDKQVQVFLDSSGWEKIKLVNNFIFPIRLPIISFLIENILMRLPILNRLAFCSMYVAQKTNIIHGEKEVSILVPCKNEELNISPLVKRIPKFGKAIQLVFIDDNSDDNTKTMINHEIKKNIRTDLKIELATSTGNGKGKAVRDGMIKAKGDICMVLDADMTVIPEDLPQFYNAIKNGYGNFINGSRLIYKLEDKSMRFFNVLGNVFFAKLFSFIIDQKITDTLCGTKVFWRKDWGKFEQMRKKLGDIDIWGEYNLIFGASFFSIKIIDLPVRYYERLEGITKMQKRINNAIYMLIVCYKAIFKIKFVKS